MWWRTLSVYFGSCRCRGRNHVDNWVREKALVPASKRTWRRRYDAKGAAARSSGRLVEAPGYVSFCLPAQSAPIHPIIDCSLDPGSR